MNILHLKYVVEVARAGTVHQAAERLRVAQPNLSRAIRDMETELGVSLFTRTPRGMRLTAEGAELVGYATKILGEIDELERLFCSDAPRKQRFSICVPRASYISQAFARFSRGIGSGSAELFYRETNALRTIRSLLEGQCSLGIIRYAEGYERQFSEMLAEKGLHGELVARFAPVVLCSAEGPLAGRAQVAPEDLSPLIEIAHADPYVPSLPEGQVLGSELEQGQARRIFVFERASQFDLLSSNPETFMWVSPVPAAQLERWNLVQRPAARPKPYRDVLVHRQGYALGELDKRFITELTQVRRQTF